MTSKPGELPKLSRLFWLIVLAGHLAAAGGWRWLMPGGFPVEHPRFWSNRVGPVVVLGWTAAAVWAARREREVPLRLLLVAYPAFWVAAAIAGRVVFPVSASRVWLAALGIAALMGLGAWMPFRRRGGVDWRAMTGVMIMAAGLGILLPLTQRGPEPDTRPSGSGEIGWVEIEEPPGSEETGRLSDRARVTLGDGAVLAQVGGLSLEVSSLLTFIDRSPDRCLTILTPRDVREGPRLRLDGVRRGRGMLEMAYHRDGPMRLKVEDAEDGGPIRIDAMTKMDRPIYSHLNSYTDVMVRGHERLGVAFSPCPEVVVEVKPADYPTGRPMRLAYLGADGIFRVVEASDGEKGPFMTLASGPLRRGEPLGITLFDGDRPAARIALLDWSAQLGTQLSPTAGWGLPVNAIEFVREGDAPGSLAVFYVTLAGTSVGRGWDSVGHREGLYRNRIRIEPASGEIAKGFGHHTTQDLDLWRSLSHDFHLGFRLGLLY
jgi:hypothetical protein